MNHSFVRQLAPALAALVLLTALSPFPALRQDEKAFITRFQLAF